MIAKIGAVKNDTRSVSRREERVKSHMMFCVVLHGRAAISLFVNELKDSYSKKMRLKGQSTMVSTIDHVFPT